MINETIALSKELVKLVPFLGCSSSNQDYKDAVKLAEYLVEFDPGNPLIELLISRIEKYENTAPTFAAFNRLLVSTSASLSFLRFLMDQHRLGPNDFTNEIGSEFLVTRILEGEVSLTSEQINSLVERFGVPVSMFMDDFSMSNR